MSCFKVVLCGLLLLVSACASLDGRIGFADEVASKADMKKFLIKTDSFTLTSYKKITSPGQDITIYIEGDGFAWASRSMVSSNPTPKEALVLTLASMDKSTNVVYLARPCQYTPFEMNKVACSSKYWAEARFSESVIASVNQAIDAVVKESAAKKVNLVGYSGGGAVAVLVASRRSDIASIRTVAGNVDTVAVNNYHQVSQLSGSLNPADYAKKIANIPQYHFSGGEDKVVPAFVAMRFAAIQEGGCAKLYVVKEATHKLGWKENWPTLLERKPSCS